jgi:hypothetical protein
MDNSWLTKLRRTEEALARFYVAHRQTGCEGCELCLDFWEGVKGGMNLYRDGESPRDPLVHLETGWQKILEAAGYWHTKTAK